jgi:transposase
MMPTTAFTRNVANALVERAERQTGSRMAAYEMVAQTVGTSSSWLRKFIKGGIDAKEPGWTTGWNILDQYSRICDRVEAEIETERAKFLALKEEIDAVNTIIDRVAERATRSAQDGKNSSDAARDEGKS